MPPAARENRRSPATARAFLVRLLDSLGDAVIEDYTVAPDMAFATVKAKDGERYNIQIHKMAGRDTEPSGPNGVKPQIHGTRD